MNRIKLAFATLALLAFGSLAGCSETVAKSPGVSDNIRKSLDQSGFKDVSISQDRDKGIVTLGGQVASENEKSQAEAIAKSFAGAQVVVGAVVLCGVGILTDVKNTRQKDPAG